MLLLNQNFPPICGLANTDCCTPLCRTHRDAPLYRCPIFSPPFTVKPKEKKKELLKFVPVIDNNIVANWTVTVEGVGSKQKQNKTRKAESVKRALT
jgi:hypothetical protein